MIISDDEGEDDVVTTTAATSVAVSVAASRKETAEMTLSDSEEDRPVLSSPHPT